MVGLVLCLVGLAFLWNLASITAIALISACLATFCFRLQFAQPPSIAGTYHLQSILLLALVAPFALDAMARWSSAVGRRRGIVLAVILVGLGSMEGARRLWNSHLDVSRQLAVHDVYATELAQAPIGAVHVSASIQDFFAVRYFQEALGERGDLVTIQTPLPTPAGFFIYGHYRGRVGALLPLAKLAFSDHDESAAILRRLILDNAHTLCFFAGTLSGFAAPPDLFTPIGILYIGNGARCGVLVNATHSVQMFHRMRTRDFFSGPVGRMFASHVAGFAVQLAFRSGVRDSRDAEGLLRSATRLYPDGFTIWHALGTWLSRASRRVEAQLALERALDLNPAFVPLWSDLIQLHLAEGDSQGAAILLDRAFRSGTLATTRAAPRVIAALAAGDLSSAFAVAPLGFAEAAVVCAEAMPTDQFSLTNRDSLLRYAAQIVPRQPHP
jgi:hypothetical protein